MKKHLNFFLLSLFFMVFVIFACDDGGSSNKGSGNLTTYSGDGVSFKMATVPGGLTFPTGLDDKGSATVAGAYRIGETEVTWELWGKVYDWATSDERGAGKYTFSGPGRMGSVFDGTGMTARHPVTNISGRDCLVWCNALTEWYNDQNDKSLVCVYTYDSGSGAQVVRDSTNANATACDGAVAGAAATGFRMLTGDEWECAARYRDGVLWTYGDHVSGDDSGACYDNDGLNEILGGMGLSEVFGEYTVYSANSGDTKTTAEVKSKKPNALGLYDMSGNVDEWCFGTGGPGSISKGANYYLDIDYHRLGRTGTNTFLFYKDGDHGFRIAMTAAD